MTSHEVYAVNQNLVIASLRPLVVGSTIPAWFIWEQPEMQSARWKVDSAATRVVALN